ncbi:MAG: Crp/Fnr family transcriptional regulator [Taibaiella sp.]|jgi:CRP-like cAMP-binding protein
MFETLHNYINSYISTPLSKSEFELIRSVFTLKNIKKRQYHLQQGDVCTHFAFVVKGAMRQYIVNDKGQEHIVHLAIENWWVGDRESWVNLAPSAYCIDAWEDSELLLISREETLKLAHQCPPFNEMIRVMDDRNNIATQKRITNSISLPAEKRYTDFVSNHPEFLDRFPQHMIASYLGIAKETLSRVRKQSTQK